MAVRFKDFSWEPVIKTHKAWWAGELERPLLLIHGRVRDKTPRSLVWNADNLPGHLNKPLDELVELTGENFECSWYAGDSYPYIFVNYGPGCLAEFTGLCTGHYATAEQTCWFEPKKDYDLYDLKIPYFEGSPWFLHCTSYLKKMIERFNGKIQLSMTDLGGMLDILASFRGTSRLLLDINDEPEEIERLIGEVFDAWWKYFDHFNKIIKGKCAGHMAWAPLWAPAETYMFQSDFSYMISPDMFRRFVVPEMTRGSRKIPCGFYHLDGVGEIPHLDHLIGIKELKGIQWIPGAGQKDVDEWPELINRILKGGKLCQLYATPKGALKLIEQTGGGKGLDMLIIGHDFSEKEADVYYQEALKIAERARRNSKG